MVFDLPMEKRTIEKKRYKSDEDSGSIKTALEGQSHEQKIDDRKIKRKCQERAIQLGSPP